MERTGKLSISPFGISSLSGTRLAVETSATPLRAATDFLRGQGFDTGSNITVTGDDGNIPEGSVFFITDAEEA